MTTLIGPRIEEEERMITGMKRDKKAKETLKDVMGGRRPKIDKERQGDAETFTQ